MADQEEQQQLQQQVPDPADQHEADLPNKVDERFGKAQDELGMHADNTVFQANGADLRGRRALRGSAEDVADRAREALSDTAPERDGREE